MNSINISLFSRLGAGNTIANLGASLASGIRRISHVIANGTRSASNSMGRLVTQLRNHASNGFTGTRVQATQNYTVPETLLNNGMGEFIQDLTQQLETQDMLRFDTKQLAEQADAVIAHEEEINQSAVSHAVRALSEAINDGVVVKIRIETLVDSGVFPLGSSTQQDLEALNRKIQQLNQSIALAKSACEGDLEAFDNTSLSHAAQAEASSPNSSASVFVANNFLQTQLMDILPLVLNQLIEIKSAQKAITQIDVIAAILNGEDPLEQTDTMRIALVDAERNGEEVKKLILELLNKKVSAK